MYNLKKNKRERGITLIALVITIIVLLILAGISIALLTGDNGILTQAARAKEETQYAKTREKVQVAVMGSYDDSGKLSLDMLKTEIQAQGGSTSGDSFPLTIVIDNEEFTIDSNGKFMYRKEMTDITGNEDKNILTYDNLGNQVIVPSGFKVVNPDGTVPDGIIIEDVGHTATMGSQFVWIPVGDVKTSTSETPVSISLGRYVFNEDGTINEELSKKEPTDQLKENSITPTYYTEGLKNEVTTNVHAKDIETFRKSSTASRGYYIGRYEARTETQRNTATNNDGLTQLTNKANEYVYNYVTQQQAASLSQNMYNDSNFQSDLMNSYAWDTAILYLQEFGNNNNYANATSVNDVIAVQGTNKLETQDVICNIYDMASNCVEWTTETCNSRCSSSMCA